MTDTRFITTSYKSISVRRTFSAAMRCILCAFALSLAWVALVDRASAQPPGDQPPMASGAVRLPELGRITGGIRNRVITGSSEEFGRELFAAGDVNGDGLQDWVVERLRCDTLSPVQHLYPIDVLLYRGVRGGLPAYESGQRIGPTEIGSRTHFLASGDFDDDNHIDLVVAAEWLDDTTDNDPMALWHKQTIIVFWGDAAGTYNLDDTTHLQGGASRWLGAVAARTADFDRDGISDLFVFAFGSFSDGMVLTSPKLQIFRGSYRGRWGRNGVPAASVWRVQDIPGSRRGWEWEDRISVLDQDCDGSVDIALHYFNDPDRAWIAVYYGGVLGNFPDTVPEAVLPIVANGRASMFADVTGDGSPELLVNCGGAGRVRIYAGRPGQRLLRQYGTGYEGPNGSEEWWPRPWAEILSPDLIDEDWTMSGFYPFIDFGDMNLDGVSEVWTWSYPYLLGYDCQERIDSLIDAWTYFPGTLRRTAQLGDIDGSGRQSVAMSIDYFPHDYYDPFPGEVIFLQSTREMPKSFEQRKLPHIAGEHCGAPTSATLPPELVGRKRSGFEARYDRTSHRILLTSSQDVIGDAVEYRIADVLGRLAANATASLHEGRAWLPVEELPSGFYILRVGQSPPLSFPFIAE